VPTGKLSQILFRLVLVLDDATGHLLDAPPAADVIGVFRKVKVVINVVLAYLCLVTSHK